MKNPPISAVVTSNSITSLVPNRSTSLPENQSRRVLGQSINSMLLILISIAVFSITGPLSAIAAEIQIGTPIVGWQGNYKIGKWTPVRIPVVVAESGPIEFSLSASDNDGNRVEYSFTAQSLPPGEQILNGLVRVGRLDSEFGIRIGAQKEIHGQPGKTEWLRKPLTPSTKLILTVGTTAGFDFSNEDKVKGDPRVATITPSELPTNPLALDGVSVLVLAGELQLTAPQSQAIQQWVQAGGRLAVSLQYDLSKARRTLDLFSGWFPIRMSDSPVIVREFGGMELFAGKNVRIPAAAALSIPSIQSDSGEILAATRSDAFLLHAPYGLGTVAVLAMDLSTSPLLEWKALNSFCARLTGISGASEAQDKAVVRSSQLSSTGITDLATQLHAVQEDFSGLQRGTPWFVMGLLLILMAVIGPLDYLIVHRLLKRPYLTWITFPLEVMICTGLASYQAQSANGAARRMNQLDIVSYDVASSTAIGRHFVNFYSPITTQTSVAVQAVPLTKSTSSGLGANVTWEGTPEPTFGGMLRPTGLQNGSKYQQQEDGSLSDMPIFQWSSKSLVAQSHQKSAGLVESDLRASVTGRLTGTITHHFEKPIDDWLIIYKNVVYRYLKKKDDVQSLPLPANQLWRVEQPMVHSREVRPYLTGIITMATPRFGTPSTNDIVAKQTTYDVLSRDPYPLVRILTFHDEVGGDRYTTLTNQVLEEEDCSRLIRLGRAILFGRLSQKLTSIQQDDQPVEPDRQDSFIRIILPVAKSTEVMKELKRVVDEK